MKGKSIFMKKKNKIIPFMALDIFLMAVLVGIDQFTKYLAVQNLMNKAPIPVIKDVLILEYLENRGAAFGMLQNQSVFFIVIGVVFVLAMLFALVKVPIHGKYHVMRFLLTLITAGAIGNMIDRATLKYVVDFIYIIYINFPVFNVADIYVTVGTLSLLILILFVWKEEDLDFKNNKNPKLHSSMVRDDESN